jgi:O-methyltransferase involved in polyketide biosynthesis
VWLAEGFFLYLRRAEVHALLDRVGTLSAPGSRLGADFINRDFLFSPVAWPLLESFSRLGSPLRFGTNDPESLLAGHGWRARAVQPGEPEADYGRWPYPVPPRGLPGLPRSFLLTARRETGGK